MTATTKSMQAEFDTLDKYLTAARETLRGGHMPDMVGLDARVAQLCKSIEQSESDVQQYCLSRLNDLLQNIDACEAEIRAFHEAVTKATQ